MYQYMSMPFGKFIFRTIEKKALVKRERESSDQFKYFVVFKLYYSISYWEQLATTGYRRILHIHWHQKKKSQMWELRRWVGNTRNIVQLIIERKLSLFGHICRMEDKRLVKGVVFGIMERRTRKGWCQMDIHSQQDGTGPCTVERESQMGIGQQRAWAHVMMDGWTLFLYIPTLIK